MSVDTDSVRLRSSARTEQRAEGEEPTVLDRATDPAGRRISQYMLTSAVLSALVFVAWVVDSKLSIGRAAFVIGLLWICAAPFFLCRAAQQRLLVFFILWYFAVFGLHTLLALLFGPTESTINFLRTNALDQAALAESDVVIIGGGVLAIAGYLIIQYLHRREPVLLSREWSYGATFWVALACWVPGFAFSLAYYMTVTPANIPSHLLHVPLNIASNLRLLTMLASVMLIYLGMRGYKPGVTWSVVAALVLIDYTMGFAANTKEVSYRIPALLVMASYFLSGRFNKKMIGLILITFIPYHLFFTVYRNEILLGRGGTAVEAVQDLEKTQAMLEKYASREQHIVRDNLQALADRVNGKTYVDIIVMRTGKDVPFQNGATLANLVYTFVPRALWPEKPNTSTGQLFNHEYGLSESSLTFVPTTFLGEFFWNFGWPGVVIGMLLVGASLGYIGRLHASPGNVTLPRFVLLLMACYYLVLRFEASIGQQYGIFGRVLIMLLVLHAGILLLRLSSLRKTSPT